MKEDYKIKITWLENAEERAEAEEIYKDLQELENRTRELTERNKTRRSKKIAKEIERLQEKATRKEKHLRRLLRTVEESEALQLLRKLDPLQIDENERYFDDDGNQIRPL